MENMTFHVAIVDPDATPKNREAFWDWFDTETMCGESRMGEVPDIHARASQAWFEEIIKEFAALNRADGRKSNNKVAKSASYSISNHVIDFTFSWPQPARAYEACLRLAA